MSPSKACDPCARSKTRCDWSDDHFCQRCSRLKISCVSTPPGPRKRREKSTRVQTLEKKVDGLMALLAVSQQSSPSSAVDTSPQPQQQVSPSMVAWTPGIPQGETPAIFTESQTLPNHLYGVHEQFIELAAGFRVTFAEADQILQEYKSHMLPHFPFVPMTHYSAHDMNREQPILLKTIITSSRPQTISVEKLISQWYREYFAYHIVVLNERRLELLQAILVFVAWQESNFFVLAQDTSILQLAIGLVGDLGLNRTPETQKVPARSIIDEATVTVRGLNLQTTRSLADRRALLGVFYVTAAARTIFRRTAPFEYTEYMQTCCEALLKAQEYPTDALLVPAVQMQQLVLQVNRVFPEKGTSDCRSFITGSDAYAITSISKRLDETVAQIPHQLLTSHLLRSHQYSVRVRLNEQVLYMLPSVGASQIFTRGQGLSDCLQGIKSGLEHVLEIPAETLPMLPFPFFAHLSFANVTLSRLLWTKDPDWDAALAFRSAGVLRTLDLLGDHFELGDQLSGSRRKIAEGDVSFLMKLAGKMRWFKSWYQARLPSDASTIDSVLANSPPRNGSAEEVRFWQELFTMDQSLAF